MWYIMSWKYHQLLLEVTRSGWESIRGLGSRIRRLCFKCAITITWKVLIWPCQCSLKRSPWGRRRLNWITGRKYFNFHQMNERVSACVHCGLIQEAVETWLFFSVKGLMTCSSLEALITGPSGSLILDLRSCLPSSAEPIGAVHQRVGCKDDLGLVYSV